MTCSPPPALFLLQDVRQGAYGACPLLPNRPPPPGGSFGNKFMRRYASVEGMDLLAPGITFAHRFRRLMGSAIRGFLICIPTFFIW